MSIYVRYSSPSSSHESKAHVNNFGREFQTLAKKKKTRSREERRGERDFVFKEPLGCRLMTDSNVRASFYKSSGKVQVPCATQTPPIHYLHAPPFPHRWPQGSRSPLTNIRSQRVQYYIETYFLLHTMKCLCRWSFFE